MAVHDLQDQLVNLFWQGFDVPTFHSRRGNQIYYDWVETEDWIVGPIYTIANGKTWDYVFAAEEGPFATIGDVEALMRWYTAPIDAFRGRVEGYHPRSAAGRADKETLLRKIAILYELGRLAVAIHVARQGVKLSP
jgi:hypothetical protein